MRNMRIVFIGCVESSQRFLNTMIAAGFVPVGVVTKKQSHFNSDFVDLTPICEKWNIPCLYVDNVNDENCLNFMRQCAPDLIYCFGWSQLIKHEAFLIPKIGIVGFHPAQLPNNRGRHPIVWALALGLAETASTFFMMDEQADTGDILSQTIIPITYEDDASSLYEKILAAGEKQILNFTAAFCDGSARMTKQLKDGNSWRKRGMMDGQIDWRMSSRAIYNLVRALSKPYPGAHFMWDGKMVKVWKVEEQTWNDVENMEPGKILRVASKTDFCIKAYDNVIHVLECDPVDLKEGEYLL